eukprot:594836-Prymnesium_polylepis.1
MASRIRFVRVGELPFSVLRVCRSRLIQFFSLAPFAVTAVQTESTPLSPVALDIEEIHGRVHSYI